MRSTVWALAIALAAAARAQESRPPEEPEEVAADVAEEAGEAAEGAADTAAGAAARARDEAAEGVPETREEAAQAARDTRGAADGALRAEASLADRCIALMRGDLDRARRADLAERCEELVRAGADRPAAEPEAGAGREPPAAGEAIRTAFTNAGQELVGRREARSRGPVSNTLVTNPLGWFSGLGVNAEYSRPLEAVDRISWVAAARYARANATNGQVSSFGVGGGVDLYIVGGRNEGLRIGPRLELALGSEDFGGTTTFGRLGASGEIGYSFIASNGITGGVAGGLGTRLAGDSQNESFESFTGGELGPYLKLGVGYSW